MYICVEIDRNNKEICIFGNEAAFLRDLYNIEGAEENKTEWLENVSENKIYFDSIDIFLTLFTVETII